jgi:type I restriction enzyme R subunit
MIQVSKTNEAALEESIEKHLLNNGYVTSDNADFNKEFAIDEKKFWQFLENTQSKELDKLRDRHNWQRMVLERLDRKIKKDGVINVLKRGLQIDNAELTLLYRTPYNNLNPDVIKNFHSNIFSIARQIYFSSHNEKSIDMVIFINGLAIATFELKNPWTGQNIYHAMKQYRDDRDPKEALFQFGRCLVHFAVDPEEIYMTSKLDGSSTYFLPFNKGNKHGKGNPVNPEGHRTAYLWKEVLTTLSLTNIIEHFAKLVEDKDKKTGKIKKTLYFPRYHQLDVVRSILAYSKAKGTGQASHVRRRYHRPGSDIQSPHHTAFNTHMRT